MKKIRNIIVLTLVACLYACQGETEFSTIQNDVKQNTNVIPIDEAISSLYEFLSETNTRSKGEMPQIANVLTINYYKNATRASSSNVDAKEMLYAVNFENEKGYAILSADKRLSEPVIAIMDEGNIEQSDIDAIARYFYANKEIVFNRYPTKGDGIITVPEYPDETFLNPNTFCSYVDSVNDNIVGDFNDDTLPLTRSTKLDDMEYHADHCTALMMCYEMARREVEDGGCGGTKISTSYTNYSIIKQTSNLLGTFKYWNQDSPFNDLYPNRRKYLLFGCKRKAPAGCFPLSVAKIMTLFKKPDVFIHNNYLVDWNILKGAEMGFTNTQKGKESAAHLLKAISEACSSWYFYAGTFTFPGNVTSYMEHIGYTEVDKCNYSYVRCTDMIDNGCPVIIYSIPDGWKVASSHAWNIDGYKIKTRKKTINHFYYGTLTRKEVIPDTCRMLHCDFGWGGPSNGYYVDNVFKLNSDTKELDIPQASTNKTNYNKHLRIIRYKNPIK